MTYIITKSVIVIILLFCFITFTKDTEASTVDPQTLFYDDYTQNSLNRYSVLNGNWNIENEKLVNKISTTNDSGRIQFGSEDWSNYELEFDVNNKNGVDVGIGFRKSTLEAISYELTLRFGHNSNYGTPQIVLSRLYWKGTSGVDLTVLGNINNITLNNNTIYHVKVRAIDKNIIVWIDNREIFNIVDNSKVIIDDGYVNFGTWSGSFGQINVEFDNVKVISIPSNHVYFLNLPWNYSGEGLSFNEAALGINTYFDHEYPLLSSGQSEPGSSGSSLMNFLGLRNNEWYSSHDGYDYGIPADVHLFDPVLAAASGVATLKKDCTPCGNTIVIDHGNGYQTRYMHLDKNGLNPSTPNLPTFVNQGTVIGKVGLTGNTTGAHIHFDVYKSNNTTSPYTFTLPDGATDPFGWQGLNSDPWETYSLGTGRTGSKSDYLWNQKVDHVDTILTHEGGTFKVGPYQFVFPVGITDNNIELHIQSAPLSRLSPLVQSVGSAISIRAYDHSGNLIHNFPGNKPYTVTVNYGDLRLQRFKVNTLNFYTQAEGAGWVQETKSGLLGQIQITLSHMSLIAVMAERIDTTAPTTTALLNGTTEYKDWYDSDVSVTLNALDNEGGLGKDYIAYQIDDSDWEIYDSPITVSSEGHHQIRYYSADLDDNIESPKSIEFYIDTTPPVLNIYTSPTYLWPPNGKLVDVSISGETFDNFTENPLTNFTVIDEYGTVQPTINAFGDIIKLVANRHGADLDGRKYTITATSTDLAGNISQESINVIVPHDQRN